MAYAELRTKSATRLCSRSSTIMCLNCSTKKLTNVKLQLRYRLFFFIVTQERNVDVEHRFGELGGPATHVSRGKKKSTRCRMVFRTEIINAEGQTETLQVCSTQIICSEYPVYTTKRSCLVPSYLSFEW